MKKLIIFCLCGFLLVGTGYAQGHGHGKGHQKHHQYHRPGPHHQGPQRRYVKVRPTYPRYTRVGAPGRDYVYIEEDWRWDPGAATWVWYGNRWVPRSGPQVVWVPGSWVNVSFGWTWQPGRWR